MKVGTFPYEAPEALAELTADGLKRTDVYSFGSLFWRTLLDGKDLIEELGFDMDTLEAAILLRQLKQEDKKMIDGAFESIADHFPSSTPIETLELIGFVLNRTLRTNPTERNLAAAQAALRNGHVNGIIEHLADMVDRNSDQIFEVQDGIQRQSFNADRVGFQLGKLGDFYDAQQNLPSYRIELHHPATGGFLFEPMKMKSLLSWEQQVELVKELKEAAKCKDAASPLGIPPYKAAFYVFQSYLVEFGGIFDTEETCYWLNLSAEPDDEWDESLFAQAWLWRICDALQCHQPLSKDKLIQYLRNSLVYGFTECAKDFRALIEKLTDPSEKQRQMSSLKKYRNLLQTYAGGVGMRHYFPSSIHKLFDLFDLGVLDGQIRAELGDHHDQYLLATHCSKSEEIDEVENRFDKIYVSNAGHGLLHFAATFGKVHVLKHILETYKCNINRGSAFRHDSPLVCAVRSAQYDCVLFLLQQNAQPGKISLGEEGPLHCLGGFEEEQGHEMQTVAKLLIDAGADIEELSSVGGDRGIAADWDSLLNISTTPLGRAVIARNISAIKVLLELGADPKGKGSLHGEGSMSPVEIAGMLFYPGILQTLLGSLEGDLGNIVFDEAWVLKAAHERKKDSIDPSCLQSRLVRLGPQYKSAVLDTFRLIRKCRDGNPPQRGSKLANAANNLLYKEVLLGDADVVEALLELDYDPDGTKDFRPLQAAVSTRNWRVFRLLLRFGADVHKRYQHLSGVEMTFLHAIAYPTQGSRTPDGAKIAQQLLAAGIPVEEPIEQCSVTPFALCVINRCFDIADVLLAHGATLNPVYASPPSQGPPISLLAGLVMTISEAALDSIHYMIQQTSSASLEKSSTEDNIEPSEGDPCLPQIQTLRLLRPKLSPIGLPSRKMSVLHQVAYWTHSVVENNWPASVHIMQLC